ncbi:membrane-bound lytic murein transglycosylase D [Ferrimonas sediminum]|uniref:Membrane-bound lytic murein transglycosylase D n=1 Tax=Ferrimonas sediminum TaxID=718193 RepID=A0A1G8WZN1_9GAMM|nr:LysM peptidoglycan-binding domain-containing protein [Ferrimonas sediminum]SDJ83567.1 membrane-bound lytic murein transglycosylase D [Ferrimonas sediminum]
MINKRLSALSLAILLTGCQTLTGSEEHALNDAATPAEVAQDSAELAPGNNNDEQEAQQPVILPPDDVWERISRQMTLTVPDNTRVDRFRKWYKANPRHLEIVSERADPYLYLIVEEVERRGLPIELALLPIVESSFDAFAYSHGAAAGLWQFTSPMGRYFGLQQNWWYDGRRDVAASTRAAMDMMEYLYNKLDHNWLYALAAYNTGEGRVFRAIKKNKAKGKPTDFWSLDLPKETERYVPQLLAVADVIRNAEEYGIDLAPIANKPQLQEIDTGSQIDLALAADMADMSVADLHRLNPGYNRWATAPDGPHKLLLPLDKADGFINALADTGSTERVNWLRYEVKNGDSLGVIAKRYHTRIGIIQSVNNLDGNMIRIGQHLLIPVAAKDPELYPFSADQRLARKQSKKRANFKLEHVVKPGDSLWTIARANKVKVSQLASWNSMAPSDTIRPGQKLVVWVNRISKKQDKTSVMRQVSYKVKSGDSLARIAKKFNVTVADLVRWNQLDSQKYLQPGQGLTLYVDVTKIST